MPSTVTLYSDIACPWCYIGERRLMKAAERIRAGDSDFAMEVVWRPFQLQPDMPEGGVPFKSFIAWKFGSPEQVRAVFARVADAGRADGIEFNFDRIPAAVNTRDAHRLVLLASGKGSGHQMAEALFKAHFTDGRDLSDPLELVDVASSAGLDADDVRSLLESDAFLDDVLASQEEAARMGIQGVPFFIFNDRYALSGAHPVDDFERALPAVKA